MESGSEPTEAGKRRPGPLFLVAAFLAGAAAFPALWSVYRGTRAGLSGMQTAGLVALGGASLAAFLAFRRVEQPIRPPDGVRAGQDGKAPPGEEAARPTSHRADAEAAEIAETAEVDLLRRALRDGPASVVITDPEGTIVHVNPRFTAVTGYSPDEVLGRNPRMLKSGEMPAETYRQMWAALASGGEWRGELLNRKKDGTQHWELVSISPLLDDEGRVWRYVGVKEDISEIKKTESQLRQLSLTDPLTGLLNRRGFFALGEQQLRIADRLRRPVHLVFLDVDRLKPVNDIFGHTEGDHLLREAGNFLRLMFRSSDILARIGGDEFAALVLETAEGSAQALVGRVREKLLQLNVMSERPYPISLSIGVTVRPAGTRAGLEALLAEADAAMYEQKKSRVLVSV